MNIFTFSIVPILCIIFGYLEIYYFSKNITSHIGYKTQLSKKNFKNWKYAQIYYGKLLTVNGFLFLLINNIIGLINLKLGNNFNIVALLSAIALGFLVEKNLTKFDKENNN